MNVNVKHTCSCHCIDRASLSRENVNMAPVKKPRRRLQRTFLKEWREFRNLTQEAAAGRLGISRTLLSKIENAKSPYSQPFLEAAADAYGTTVASLLMRDPTRSGSLWSIEDQLQKADPAKRAEIISVVEVMLRRAG